MKKVILAAVFPALLLVGCGSGTPTCESSDTQDLVIEIADRELAKVIGRSRADTVDWSLGEIETTSFHESTGFSRCSAKVYIEGPNGKRTTKITYTVKPQSDGRFEVMVYGL